MAHIKFTCRDRIPLFTCIRSNTKFVTEMMNRTFRFKTLHISHVGYVMPMLDGMTVGFVAILAISGITLTVRACPQLCIVS